MQGKQDAAMALREQIRLAKKASTSSVNARISTLESVLDELETYQRLEAALQEVVFVQGEVAYECSRRGDGWHVTKNDDGDLSYVGVWDSLPKFAAIKEQTK